MGWPLKMGIFGQIIETWIYLDKEESLTDNFFCSHAIQLVFLPPIVPLRGKRMVYCCYVNL